MLWIALEHHEGDLGVHGSRLGACGCRLAADRCANVTDVTQSLAVVAALSRGVQARAGKVAISFDW